MGQEELNNPRADRMGPVLLAAGYYAVLLELKGEYALMEYRRNGVFATIVTEAAPSRRPVVVVPQQSIKLKHQDQSVECVKAAISNLQQFCTSSQQATHEPYMFFPQDG